MTQLSFTLREDFLAPYRTKQAPFGYRDAGGNSVGEITFLRTYSRKKEDGTKETWVDVCERVINGMYSVQKDYAKANRLPWSDSKAAASAKEAFDRLFHLKWTPPGRGLWIMGTPIVHEQGNSAALQNCFSGDTEIITALGVKELQEVAGTTQTVLTEGGAWVQAPVSSFGVQPLMKVTLSRQGREKVIYATPDHRWFAAGRQGNGKESYREVLTKDLTDDMRLQEVFGQGIKGKVTPSAFGIAHGFAYGDGRTSQGDRNENSVTLFGEKDSVLAKYFALCPSRVNRVSIGGTEYTSLPNFFRQLPSIMENKSYLYGWLAGYFAADGSVTTDGQVTLSSSDYHSLRFVRDICYVLGIGTYEIRTGSRVSNLTGHEHEIHTISFMRDTLTEDFFLIEEHRRRWLENPAKSRSHWWVKSVEQTDRVEEVFCARVEGYGKFALADNILTGNCSFISTNEMTKHNPAKPFEFLMEASMLGVGVGFDNKGAEKEFPIYQPSEEMAFVVPDTREGWVESVGLLINSYLKPDQPVWVFDYSEVRPAGTPIKTFGGTAAGPDPLKKLHKHIRAIFDGREGQLLTKVDIADLGNLIGVCVVSGNVRRSAELLIGSATDDDFLNLKNAKRFPQRNSYSAKNPGWGWMSNNSVEVEVGQDISHIVENIAINGEPGVIWMDTTRAYGRLKDAPNNKDHRAAGYNPCAEQSLESSECCTLTETYLSRHDSLEDYKRTLKFAYLYAKTVTLIPTHWSDTNAVMARNRRIGTSMSGIANFTDHHGLPELRRWMDEGYETVQYYDRVYSEWLGIRESIKTTTVKPSGTVSILAGESPGVHWTPGGEYFMRAIRFSNEDPMLPLFRFSGYTVEAAAESPDTTSVVYFPIHSGAKRSEKDVTIFEKIALAATAQRYWSDNAVSVTVSFDAKKERDHVPTVLHMYDGQLKTVSFLPMGDTVYPQQPYTQITQEQYEDYTFRLLPLDLSGVYAGLAADAIGEGYCSTDSCEIKNLNENMKDLKATGDKTVTLRS